VFLITTKAQLLSHPSLHTEPVDLQENEMAKNQVQFQKGLSLPEFLRQYGSEEQCRTALYRWRWPRGFVCPACGHGGCCALNERPVYQCYRCHRQTSVTSGTLFEGIKPPLRTWFLGMYLLTQSKNGVAALELMRQLGVSYNAAWRMKHKLMQAMKERDDSQPLVGTVQLDDAYWGGERHNGERGRGGAEQGPFRGCGGDR
jgi:transposase-like protein